MISLKEACTLILDKAPVLEAETVEVDESLGRIAAEDIISPVDHPLFDNSPVDGYGLRFDDIEGSESNELEVIGELKAGDIPELVVKEKQAARIFTGAAIPNGIDTIVMQEYTVRDGDRVMVNDLKLWKGANIRKKGEQLKIGAVAIEKFSRLNPASIGLLASLGVRSLKVSRKPKVQIVVTGNEFAEPGTELQKGKIYESNGMMLCAALRKSSIDSEYTKCIDDLDQLKSAINSAENNGDIVIISGGVSVGDYDYTKRALEESGYTSVFHKVAQKPGKPLLFAEKRSKFAFGLPGNPRSVLVCFYMYVYPFISKMMGAEAPSLPLLQLPINHDYKKKPDEKAYLLNAKINDNSVSILEGQGSHMLHSFAIADALAILPENKNTFTKGDTISVHLLPRC